LLHRFEAAFFAISDRCSGVRAAARAAPPFFSRPRCGAPSTGRRRYP